MTYIVMSTAVTDDLVFPDREPMPGVAGGAGIYALSGLKVWTDDVLLVTGVGEDYLPRYGGWFARNGLPTDGLIVKDAVTPRTTVRYFADGEREETPVFGPGHYRKIMPEAADLEPFIAKAKGLYVFRNADSAFWEPLLRLREKHAFRMLWEVAADAAVPELRDAVETIARRADIVSINVQEAKTMYAASSAEEAAERLERLGVPLVFLRLGKRGALMLSQGKRYAVPSVPGTPVVDVTGGGNGSSGAVLFGFCEGKGPVMTGLMGSVSAACCIAQFGPPSRLDETLREWAELAAERLYHDWMEGNDERNPL